MDKFKKLLSGTLRVVGAILDTIITGIMLYVLFMYSIGDLKIIHMTEHMWVVTIH